MTNESQSSPANEIPLPDAADVADAETAQQTARAASDTTERFMRGDAMRDLYERMRPDQRTAIAGELIRLLVLSGDDHAEQFRQQFQQHTQITSDASEELLSADQVAAVDSYVRQQHPELIAQLLTHPVTQSALRSPGTRFGDEEEVPANADKIMPTENVATSGAAYGTAWMMMELDGEESDRLVEDPHEGSVEPSGEIERKQRMRDVGKDEEVPAPDQTDIDY